MENNNRARLLTIDERMEQLGHSKQYLKELARLTQAENLPAGWATPQQQRCRAVLKALRKVIQWKRQKI